MEETPHDKPALFKKWTSWYWLVTGVLMLQIIVYYLITLSFS